MSFIQNHLLGIEGLEQSAIREILDKAEEYADLNQKTKKRVDVLSGLTQINMFFENSTRTQASFELAGKRLGADVMNMALQGSSIKKGETLALVGESDNALFGSSKRHEIAFNMLKINTKTNNDNGILFLTSNDNIKPKTNHIIIILVQSIDFLAFTGLIF